MKKEGNSRLQNWWKRKSIKTFQFKSEKNKFIIVLMLMDFRKRKRVEIFIWRCPSRHWIWLKSDRSLLIILIRQNLFAFVSTETSLSLMQRRSCEWNSRSDWQLINFKIYLHLNWKVHRREKVSRKFAINFPIVSRQLFCRTMSMNNLIPMLISAICRNDYINKDRSRFLWAQFIVLFIGVAEKTFPELERKSTKMLIKSLVV